MDGKEKKLSKNLLIISIGSFSSKILSFLFLPLYTHVLSTADYGSADLISTTVSLLLPLATLVIGEAMMRFALDRHYPTGSVFFSGVKAIKLSFPLVLILSLFLIIFEDFKNYYYILLIHLISSCVYNVLSYYARGIDAVKEYSIAGIIVTLGIVFFNIVFLAVFKLGVIAYMCSYVFADILSSIYLLLCRRIRTSINERNKECENELQHELKKYSLPLVPNSISWWISNSSDKYILIFFQGIAINGIYSISYKIPSLIGLITSIFSSAWVISSVDNFGSLQSKRFYEKIYSNYISIIGFVSSGLLLFNKPVAHILFASDFYEAWKYQPILIIGVAFHALGGFVGSIYTAAKKTKMIFITTLCGALLNIILNLLLIPFFSAYGAAIATTISYISVWLYRTIDSKKIMKLDILWIKPLVVAFALLIQLICIYQTGYLWNMLSFVAFILISLLYRTELYSIFTAFLPKRFKKK